MGDSLFTGAVWWVLVPLALFWVLPPVVAFFIALRIRVQPHAQRVVDEADVPPGLRAWLVEVASKDTRQLGFEPAAFLHVRDEEATPPSDTYALLLRSEGGRTHARVRSRRVPETFDAVAVAFTTFFADATCVTTVAGQCHEALDDPPGFHLADEFSLTLPDQYARHRREVERREVAAPVVVHDSDALVAAMNTLGVRELEHYVATGLFERAPGSDIASFTLRGAWALARRFARLKRSWERRTAALHAAWRRDPSAFPAASPGALERAYLRHQALRIARPSRRVGPWILAATALPFIASMWGLGGIQGILVLSAVVLFHELGHFAAMKWRGYGNTSVFFVPFLGGATVGSKPNASLRDEILVLLAGPMPGLLLAAALAVLLPEVMRAPIGRMLLITLAGLNAVNLLPLWPLDGGRIVHAVLLARRPSIDSAMRVVAIAAFAAFGVAAGDGALFVLPLFGALTLPHAFRVTNLEGVLRKVMGAGPAQPADLPRVVHAVQEKHPGLRAAAKITMIRELMQRLSHPPPKFSGALGWSLAYLGSLVVMVGCLGILVFSLAGTPTTALPCGAPRIDLDAPGRPAARPARVIMGGTTSDVMTQAQIMGHLRQHAALPAVLCARAPWDGVSAAEVRARRTFLLLHRAGSPEGGTAPSGPHRVAAARKILAEVAGSPDVDEAFAGDYLAWLESSQGEAETSRLSAQLGRADRCPSTTQPVPITLGSRDILIDIAYERRNEDVWAARDWLCHNKVEEVGYVVHCATPRGLEPCAP